MLSDAEIVSIIGKEKSAAISYEGEISKKRAYLMDRYNSKPYGDEIDGQSKVLTSDIADVVEGMLPSLMRVFTQGKYIAQFEADRQNYDDEANQKTEFANYIFMRQNDGILKLHDMFKDALIQYTGTVKVYWCEDKTVSYEGYKGLSVLELQKLQLDQESEITDLTQEDQYFVDDQGQQQQIPSFNCKVKRTTKKGRIKVENVPPEEFLIARNARDFRKLRFCCHKSKKMRSELIEMGFKKKIVDKLPGNQGEDISSREAMARYSSYDGIIDENPSNDKANDIIALNEIYMQLDVDGDGVSEYWQFFEAGNELLEKNQVDDHPFATVVPVPIPHRAIGNCPAEQAADIQFVKTTLVRQMLNNIYQSNYPRTLANDRVNLEDLLTPRAAGVIRVSGEGDIGNSAMPFVVQSQSGDILQAVEYMDTAREVRTGLTRYNQGLDAESLNKTATGFRGMMDMSQQRIELIARLFAEGGVKDIFKKIIMLATRYQDDALQLRVTGGFMEIDPTAWRANLDCRIDVGLGSGDRTEKIVNLNNISNIQQGLIESGSVLVDQEKLFNTYKKLITETGLKEVSEYFNDPSVPNELLMAQNEQLSAQLQQMKQMQQNPLVEVENAKTQGRLAQQESQQQFDAQKFMAQLQADQEQFRQELTKQMTELELKYNANVPGSVV